jgi:hypothetical protein
MQGFIPKNISWGVEGISSWFFRPLTGKTLKICAAQQIA